MSSVAVYTVSLGCPKNLVDTERILAQLGDFFEPAEDIAGSDMVLVNTCGFIQPAVEESIQTILEIASDINDLELGPPLVVTGCLPARYGQEAVRGLPEVDVWLGFAEQQDWLSVLIERLSRDSRWPGLAAKLGRARQEHVMDARPRVQSTPPGYAYLKISEGCGHACSFCLIPSIRGGLRSEAREDLRLEAERLVRQGARELCLVAQDVTAYGRDRAARSELPSLLEDLAGLSGLAWLRLLYLYPTGVNPELLRFLKELGPPFLPYFDIPLQHAHPDVLKRMGRPFAGNPWKVVELVHSFFPEASLRTSLIVGFPGETEEHFNALKAFVSQVGFSHLGVFTFSPEEGTSAAALPDRVAAERAEARREELMAIQAEISSRRLAAYRGTTLDILVDGPDPEWPTLFQGRAWFQAPEIDGITYVSGLDIRPGNMVRVCIDGSTAHDLSGLAEL